MRTFLISVMHFGHANIIKYENRPFASAEEMDNTIITNWKSIVKNKDVVLVLGDVSFYNKEKTQQIIKNLPGLKTLILGNHDRSRSSTFWRDIGFHNVYKYPIIFRDFYMVSHEPLYINSSMPYINIHGHLHSNNINNNTKQYFNASVENINYTPILFESILSKIGV